MHRVFIALGSNIEPADNIRRAVLALGAVVRLGGISTVYRTPAIDRPEQDDYYNTVVVARTELSLRSLHDALRAIEQQLGRVRGQDKFAPRTIDLDLLLYDDLVMDEPDLRLPDPEIASRSFLAAGLYELEPQLVLPGSGRAVRALAHQTTASAMTPLTDYTRSLLEDAELGRS